MSERAARRVAGGTLLLGLLCAATAGALQVLTRNARVDYYGIRGFQGAFGLIIGGTGWLIASRRNRNPIGWILLGAGFISTLQAVASGYVTYSVVHHNGSLPLTRFLSWLPVWMWVFIVVPMVTFLFLLFPEGRLESTRHRALAVYCGVATLVFAGVISVTPGQAGEIVHGVANPFAVSQKTFNKLTPVLALFIIAVVASIAVLVSRFRRSTGELRQQMKLITFAGTLAGISIIVSTTTLGTGAVPTSLLSRTAAIAVIVSFAAIPVSAGFAILRLGLYEIDVVINKTIVYGVVAAFITVVYVLLVLVVGAFANWANQDFALAVTVVAALAIQPVRTRATRFANRMVFGKRATPYEALSAFGERISGGVSTDDVLPQLARLTTEATAATHASVWLAVGSSLIPAASWPLDVFELRPVAVSESEIAGFDRVYPVKHQGELLGALAVRTTPAEPLSHAQEKLLEDLASQAALVMRNGRLIAELQASRQRLVATADHERRRIERNLHDGAQQHLVALSVKLSLVSQLVSSDPSAATQLLAEVRGDATEALENLRDLARGIYPPLLADQGLGAALTAQSKKAPIPVEVECDGLARYPQEVESAVYFCVLEALQNVGKYAGDARARVRLASQNGSVVFSVSDDGAGFDPATRPRGSGLVNMADRLEALGGRMDVTSAPGKGTTVTGTVPFGS